MRLGWGQILLCYGSLLQHVPLLWLASLSERHRWEGVFLLWEWHPISRQSSVLLRWSVIHPWHTVTLCANIDSLATQVTLDNKEVTIVCKVVTGWATVLLHPSTKLKQTRFLIDLIIHNPAPSNILSRARLPPRTWSMEVCLWLSWISDPLGELWSLSSHHWLPTHSNHHRSHTWIRSLFPMLYSNERFASS